ncbi:MAG: hypothetical protein P1U36_03560 [Legionellaceae bacterium]|nr:hypothetical protein [Legionellaceae bacterium]
MLNKILGAIVYFLIRVPLIAVAVMLSFFLFVDKLMEGKYREAFKGLSLSPFKALWVMFELSSLALSMGWSCGFTELFRGSWEDTRSFFSDIAEINPNLFFSVMVPDLVGIFEGGYVAAILNKLTLFFFLDKFFKTYKNYDDSPHNPLNTSMMNEVFKGVIKEQQSDVMAHESEIHDEIETFLGARVAGAIADESLLMNASLRCFMRLKQESEGKSFGAIDLSSGTAQNPLHVLYFVWHEVKRQYASEPQVCAAKQELLASFLGHIQRGFMRIENPDDHAADDPECPTGAVNILLSVLKIEPTLLESCDKIRQLLDERLNQLYNQEHNVQIYIQNKFGLSVTWKKEAFIDNSKPKITYYARFLNETKQGQNITKVKVITSEELEASAEGALEAWSRPVTS